MTDLHHTLEASAALAASGRCWFCGEPCPGARCADRDACMARQLAIPGGPPSGHPCGTGACPEDEPCGACAAAYSEPWAEPDGDDGADVPTLGNSRADIAAETNAIERRGVTEREATGCISPATLDAYAHNQAAWLALEDGERAARLAEDDAAESGEEIV